MTSANGIARLAYRAVERHLYLPLKWRVQSMVRRALVSGASGDVTAVTITAQPMSGPSGEIHEEVEGVLPPGFTAIPPDGSEAVLLCVNGDTGHPIVILSASARLAGLASGEAAIHDAANVTTGARVVVRVDGTVEAQPGVGGVVRLGAPAPAPAPAIARATDPVALNASDVAAFNALITAWNLSQPGGGPVLSVPGVTLPAITGTGTITAGGTGSVST